MPEFDAFFRKFSPAIYSYLARLLGDAERANDLFQRVFLKAYIHFRDRRSPGGERSWIYMIATNEARDEMRRRRRDPVKPMDLPDLRTRPEADPSISAEDRELAREILELKPDADRVCFLWEPGRHQADKICFDLKIDII